MTAARDPLRLLRVALRDGDQALALALIRRFRFDPALVRRADLELQAQPRARPSPTS